MAKGLRSLYFTQTTCCLLLVALLFFPEPCFCSNFKRFNASTVVTQWSSGGATWYGNRYGAGTDAGACGYGNAVSQPPFSSLITAAGPYLYKDGKECGACYQVLCTAHPSCSGSPVRVVISDFCGGGPFASGTAHFDLSGTAFGAMARTGQEDQLRNAGVLNISYTRVSCDYLGRTVTFRVEPGANMYSFSMLIEFQEGDGDLASVALGEASSSGLVWREMRQSWGAVWRLDAGHQLQAPYSIKLRSEYSGETFVAQNIIPKGWMPGGTY